MASATGLLADEAEKRGEDSTPLRLSVRAFRKIVLAGLPHREVNACSTVRWPECLGSIEERLSDVLRNALDESVAILDRLTIGERPIRRTATSELDPTIKGNLHLSDAKIAELHNAKNGTNFTRGQAKSRRHYLDIKKQPG